MKVFLALALTATATHAGDSQRQAQRLREEALFHIRNAPTSVAIPQRTLFGGKSYPWHVGINATEFFCGESAKSGGGISNDRSTYDPAWRTHFGGVDNPDPAKRHNFAPATFHPRLSCWYCALPYTDIENGHTKPSARSIHWYRERFRADGISVMVGTWVECRYGGRVCYLQVVDTGPFKTDSFAYCFGNARPEPNRNHDAGIDLSPAAYQFLGLTDIQPVSWRFCRPQDVPIGPWRMYGDVASRSKASNAQ
jgi:hypothetical protein